MTRRSFILMLAAGACGSAYPGMEAEELDRIERLTALFRRRWACPVIAAIHRAQGAKFIALVNTLGSNPGAMRQTLDELLDIGWIQRNPGYGHPMRPEYLLTARGEKLAPACTRLDAIFSRLQIQDVALRKWSMPALYVIGDGPTRFTQVVRSLGDVTDRAVSLALKDLSGAAMIAKNLIDGPPPASVYAAAGSGEVLLPVLDEV